MFAIEKIIIEKNNKCNMSNKESEKMGKTLFSWFSADEDGNVVAKTDVKENGEVHRYTYTELDDISKGHGHAIYDSLEDFYNDDLRWERDKEDDSSKNRPWHGNGYNMSIEDLKELKEHLLKQKFNTTSKLILKKTL